VVLPPAPKGHPAKRRTSATRAARAQQNRSMGGEKGCRLRPAHIDQGLRRCRPRRAIAFKVFWQLVPNSLAGLFGLVGFGASRIWKYPGWAIKGMLRFARSILVASLAGQAPTARFIDRGRKGLTVEQTFATSYAASIHVGGRSILSSTSSIACMA